MRIVKTADFAKQLVKLPLEIRRAFSRQEKIFVADSRDSRLHLKKLNTSDEIFSFRITRNYRCLFYFYQDEVVIFFAIDHRKDVYR